MKTELTMRGFQTINNERVYNEAISINGYSHADPMVIIETLDEHMKLSSLLSG